MLLKIQASCILRIMSRSLIKIKDRLNLTRFVTVSVIVGASVFNIGRRSNLSFKLDVTLCCE